MDHVALQRGRGCAHSSLVEREDVCKGHFHTIMGLWEGDMHGTSTVI